MVETNYIVPMVVAAVIAFLIIIYVIIALIRGKKKVEKKEIKEFQPKTPNPIKSEDIEKPLFQIEKQQGIPEIPDFKDSSEINIRYPLIPPYCFAHIYWDQNETELVYKIEEPELNQEEKKILKLLESGIRELINLSFINVKNPDTILLYLEKNVRVLMTELSIEVTKSSFLKLIYYIYRDFVGLNELEPLMNDYYIEDVECNGIKSPVYIVHRKFRNIRTSLNYDNIPQLASFVEKLAQKSGKHVSYAEPLLDSSLPDGSRVNATYTQDITSKGPSFTIRKFTKEPWSPIQLMEKETVSAEALAYIWMLIEHERSFMVIGGTGSGKTSFLNCIAFFLPPQDRIVSIEDTRELALEHENWLPSVARAGVGLSNLAGERYGEVSLFDLLKEAFRQRPDYIIVGEIRGKEAFVLMQGISSGHPSYGTMHAESAETMVRRLQTPPISLSGSLIEGLSAVCVMKQTMVKGKPARKLSSVDELLEVKENLAGVRTNNVIKWDPRTNKFHFNSKSKAIYDISIQFGKNTGELLTELKRRTILLDTLYKKKIAGFKEVQKIIHKYYKDPESVLRKFGIK